MLDLSGSPGHADQLRAAQVPPDTTQEGEEMGWRLEQTLPLGGLGIQEVWIQTEKA